MNGTPNGAYVMQDPYVQGANDPWAGAPQGQNQSQTQGQGGMPPQTAPQQAVQPTGQTAQAAGVMEANMRHGLSEEVIGSPISVEEAYQGSMRGMLGREIGAYIAATFLMGNGELVRWEGRLYEVGNNYIVIYQQEQGRYVVGDINSLRFVEFSESGNRMGTMIRPCTNTPTSW